MEWNSKWDETKMGWDLNRMRLKRDEIKMGWNFPDLVFPFLQEYKVDRILLVAWSILSSRNECKLLNDYENASQEIDR